MPDQTPTFPQMAPFDHGDALAMIASLITLWLGIFSLVLAGGVAMFAAIGTTTSILSG